jgi:aryl-alcohol dehydrogenase-like predicted oxidoreductase
MRALEKLIDLGKIKYIGLSDYPVELIEVARNCLAKHDIVSIQVRYNLIERYAEIDHIPYAEKNNLMLLAWSPLAKGILSGKYSLEDATKFTDLRINEPLFNPENYKEVLKLIEVLKEIGKKYEKTPSQVALNWLINYSEVVIPIPGAKNENQVMENANASGWKMEYKDWYELDRISRSLNISYVTW